MGQFLFRFCIAWVIAVGFVSGRAYASDLRISVAQQNGNAVPNASVGLTGATAGLAFSRETEQSGEAVFPDLAPGLYHVVVTKLGFEPLRTAVEVKSDRTAYLSVTLLEHLVQIGSVRASSTASVAYQTINDASVVRKVSPTITDALNHLGGVSVGSGANGIGLTASLQGRDPSQTAYTLNGVATASGAALAVNTDLLSAAQIQQDSDTINLSFLGPSESPRYGSEINLGNVDSTFLKSTAQGSSGNFGFAAAHTIRDAASALNGRTYGDESGETYLHHGGLVSVGNYIDVTAQIADWSVALSGTTSYGRSQPIPTYLGGSMPAGLGPFVSSRTDSSNPIVTANGTLSGLGVSLSLSQFHVRTIEDDRKALLASIAAPSYSDEAAGGTDLTVSLDRSVNDKLSYHLLTTIVHSSSSAIADFGSTVSQATQSHAQDHIRFERVSKPNGDLTLHSSISAARVDTNPWYFSGNTSAALQLPAQQNLLATVAVGRHPLISNDAQALQALPDPRFASFDCGAGTVTVNGPGATSAVPSSVEVSATYAKSSRLGSISVHAYDEIERGILLTSASVSAPDEPSGFFPPMYLGELGSAYQTVGGCLGAPSLSKIFVLQDVSGIGVRYSGFDIFGSLAAGRNVVISGSIAGTGATLISRDQRLASPFSPYVANAQLPNIAPRAFSATLDWASPSRTSEALLNISSVSANNPRNLPGYSIVSAGFVRHLSATLDAIVIGTNLTSQFDGLFVTAADAVPLPTSQTPFATLAAPIGPSRIYAGLQCKFGAGYSADR